MRSFIKKYERSMMLGLVIFLLIVFTVTADIQTVARSGGGNGPSRDAIAGEFRVIPGSGDKVEVPWGEFTQARNRLSIINKMSQSGKVTDTAAWTQILLLETAKRIGITVSDQELVTTVNLWTRNMVRDDREQYKLWVRRSFGVTAREFEEAIRAQMTASRVRDLYRDSFEIAPPASRKDIVKKMGDQKIERLRVRYGSLGAAKFIDAERAAFEADEKAQDALKTFFDKDAAVQSESAGFRHPRRFKFEAMYTLHHLVTEEDYKKIEALFKRAYPQLDLEKLEETEKEKKAFFGYYTDRLLELVGSSWDKVKAANPADKPEPGAKPTPDPLVTPEQRAIWKERGYEIAEQQIDRELRVRGMYRWFKDEAIKNDRVSLKVIFDHLQKSDDKDDPICSTEMGKGLIVYFAPKDPLTADAIEDLEDRGVRFTHNTRNRVTGLAGGSLPKVKRIADVMGEAGHGRMLLRLVDVESERRKTFEELDKSERKTLLNEWYLPHQARASAKKAFEDLRTQLVDGKVDAAAFQKHIEDLGGRFYDEEWITASTDFIGEPSKDEFWPRAYRHMSDRHFLQRALWTVLATDLKKEIKSGDYLPVQVNSPLEDEDYGAAYLVQMLERQLPDEGTVSRLEFARYVSNTRQRRSMEERDRWERHIDRTLADFEFEFFGDMDGRMKREKDERTEARTSNR